MVRKFSLAMGLVALALFVSVQAGAQDRAQDPAQKGQVGQQKNTHTGKFLSAEGAGKSFKMEDKSGKEHSHTLAADAKITGPDGKECKLTELKRGQMIRVTTRENDKTTATKVEAIRELNNKNPQPRQQ
jgi:hypothetical protein